MHRAASRGFLLFAFGLCACQSGELVQPKSGINPGRPSFATSEGYVCPENWIRQATIPGNIFPYHKTIVGKASYIMPFDRLVDISATGLEKGRYVIGSGGPFQSDDGKIIILSGKITGWCYYTPTSIPGSLDNYSGSLSVTDFDGEVADVPPPPPPPQGECDDPLTDMVEECTPDNPPPSGTTSYGGSTSLTGYTSTGSSGSVWACYVTDWYDQYGNYLGTDVDYCQLEPK